VTAVALGTLNGRPVIVSVALDVFSGGVAGTVRVWDLATGAPHGKPLGHAGLTSVAAGTLDGRSVIVSGGNDRTVRVWDADGHAI
jgi:WD40 repeat protein